MKNSTDKPVILSASRTKDMVHRSPDLLADILLGRAPCRWGPRSPFGIVDPEQLHTLVLWTKDPRNLLQHHRLRSVLLDLHHTHHAQISLQITATGLGGSFIEPGIPNWQEVHAILSELLAEGWIDPAAAVYRFDPFIEMRTPGGRILSNASASLFKKLCDAFTSLGITRVTTSRADSAHYPRALERINSVGLEWLRISDNRAENLCRQMDEICRERGAEFSICCEPAIKSLMENWGCIDARLLNRTKGESYAPATEEPHNKIGRQRPACQCTYSRDIGYSTGSATCYSGGYGCLYCYSQGNAKLPDIDRIQNEISAFDHDPEGYLRSRDLPEELLGENK